MKILLMYNPEAGNWFFPLNDIVNTLINNGAEVILQNTKETDFLKVLSHSCDFIIIAGGDGTIGKIIKHILSKPIPLAILPFGSANNVAKSLKIDENVAKIIFNWKNKNYKNFRLGALSLGKKKAFFLESAGWGLFTQMLMDKNQEKPEFNPIDKNKSGIDRLLRIVSGIKPSHYDVFLDGRDYSGNYLWIEIMNTQDMGPQLCLAPQSRPDDGLLDVVLVKDEEKEKLRLFLLNQSLKENDFFLKPLRAETIKIGSPGFMHLDGDIYPPMNPKLRDLFEISLHPQTVQIINSRG